MLFSATTALLGLAATVLSAPVIGIQKRAVIAHDAVVGFAETLPSGVTGTLYLKYKPYLKNDNGCVPFPAVDAAGNTGCVRLFLTFSKTNIREKLTQDRCCAQRWPRSLRLLLRELLLQHRPSLRSSGELQRSVRDHVFVVLAQGLSLGRSGTSSRLGKYCRVDLGGFDNCDAAGCCGECAWGF